MKKYTVDVMKVERVTVQAETKEQAGQKAKASVVGDVHEIYVHEGEEE